MSGSTTANKPGRLELSAAVMQTMSSFARNGDPNNTSLGVTWATWPRTLKFDASPTAKSISVD